MAAHIVARWLLLVVVLGGGAGILVQHATDTGLAAPLRTIALQQARPYRVLVDPRAGRAFVTDGVGSVEMLDTADGHLLRHIQGLQTIAISSRSGHLFVVAPAHLGNGSVAQMVDSRSGALLRTIPFGGQIVGGTVDEHAGLVVVLSLGLPGRAGTATTLDAQTGAPLRRTTVGRNPWGAVADERTGRIFVADRDSGTVSVLASRSGVLLGTTAIGQNPRALAVDTSTARVFVAALGPVFASGYGRGGINVLDARTGKPVGRTPLGPEVGALAVDARTSHVFVVVDPGAVAMLDARTGTLIRMIHVGGRLFALAVDAHAGRLFVSGVQDSGRIGPVTIRAGRGVVTVLETTRGDTLRTIGVGSTPVSLAVDELRGYAFVTNQGDSSVAMLDAAR